MPNQERKGKEQGMQTSRGRGEITGRDPLAEFWNDPFGFFQRDWPMQRDSWPSRFVGQRTAGLWAPQIETFQRGDQFIVRADLPGLNKDDVNIEVTDDALTIQGERRDEHTEDREGYYRSERSYGSFYRTVPLPEGAITESAKANFNNGVLEITVQAPPREVSQRRRIQISGANESGRTDKDKDRSKSETGR